MKAWIQIALKILEDTLKPVPQETNELDWKSDISENNIKLSNHLSAFANHPGGGYIVFGINNKTGTVIGMDKLKIDSIVERLANISRENLTPQSKLDHTVCEYHEKPILIIHVKESSVKPVHLKSGTMEDAYIRTGGTTRKATRQEVGGLLLNSKSPRWEELSASKLVNEQEVLNLLDYRAILSLLGKPVPSSANEIMDWLVKEKIDGSGYYITNFGAITSAVDIRQFDDISRKSIRVIKYKGVNKLETENDFPGNKGYAIAFSGLITFLKAMLPHSEVIKNALRKETSVYPEVALRELIANALIHQDFSIRGSSVMIEIFQDRIEITNPGKLLPSKKIDRLIGTNPESRNEILASAMRRFHICEERGSGFVKAVTAIELYGLPPLVFEE
ncbi:MAG: ATP-binding protein, partial [Bacteroidota bacterium]